MRAMAQEHQFGDASSVSERLIRQALGVADRTLDEIQPTPMVGSNPEATLRGFEYGFQRAGCVNHKSGSVRGPGEQSPGPTRPSRHRALRAVGARMPLGTSRWRWGWLAGKPCRLRIPIKPAPTWGSGRAATPGCAQGAAGSARSCSIFSRIHTSPVAPCHFSSPGQKCRR